MKVFLMHPYRDLEFEKPLPAHTLELMQDLGLHILLETMAQGDESILRIVKQALLSQAGDPVEILFRQAVLKDCLNNPEVVRDMYRVALQALEGRRRLWLGKYGSFPDSILSGARGMLEFYLGSLEAMREIALKHAHRFQSQGFCRFMAMLQTELQPDYLACLRDHVQMLRFRQGVLVSAQLGPGNEGCNYVLRRPLTQKSGWLASVVGRWKSRNYSFSLHPRDDSGAMALGELRNKGIARAANAVAQAADHVEAFWKALQRELAFYVGCLNLAHALERLGEPIAFPELFPTGTRSMRFKGLYDPCLALQMGQKVVGNDMVAQGKDLVIITGANQGGKSTFLRSLGISQLMMQSGMFVPAESFSAELSTGLFTHYKKQEDSSMKSGKLDEELARMSSIVEALGPGSMVLFNESFGTTNEHEGSEIAWEIVNGLLESGVKVFFVTHLYEFARRYFDRECSNVIFLRAQRECDGTRTFKLVEGKPLATSHGMDLYKLIFQDQKLPKTQGESSEAICSQGNKA
ncbi:MAG: DNA mismatch repair protein MutS [bacterium]